MAAHSTTNVCIDMEASNLRYIVMLIDSKSKDHDGRIFCSIAEARDYAALIMEGGWYTDKAVIGMFVMDPKCESMSISMVETIGFKGDKKNVNQLELFK